MSPYPQSIACWYWHTGCVRDICSNSIWSKHVLHSATLNIYTHYMHSVVVQDFVSGRVCCGRTLLNYFDMTSYHWNVRQNTVTWRWWMHGKNNVTSYTKWSLPQSIAQCGHTTSCIRHLVSDRWLSLSWKENVYNVRQITLYGEERRIE
jgi:hypothetical protein